MHSLKDNFGRRFSYLRLSVTKVCNFRCSYCLPDGYRSCGTASFLRIDEIARLVRGLAALGLWKVRLTGGEPSVRNDLTDIIATVAKTSGIECVALTTNGYRLHKQILNWRAAGLNALNISVDSLNAQKFLAITGHDRLPQLLQSIDHALCLNFSAIKLNAVLLKGINDDELSIWLEYLRDRPLSLRFIELMQTGDNLSYFHRHHLSMSAIETPLREAGWRPIAPTTGAGPAREMSHPDYAGRIGLIAPYAKDFCAGCNRLRVTADGNLRLCLFGDTQWSLRQLLQEDDQQEELMAQIVNQLRFKHISHFLHQGDVGNISNLAGVGG